jgi:hypothetical protein
MLVSAGPASECLSVMPLAYVDIRPCILLGTIPLLLTTAWLYTRVVRTRAGYITIAALWVAVFLAAYQFVFYGPFVDQKRVVHAAATFSIRDDATPPAVELAFKDLPFPGLRTTDADVLAHVRTLPNRDVDVAVELTYDFGKARGMNLAFAYVDGVLFRPEP